MLETKFQLIAWLFLAAFSLSLTGCSTYDKTEAYKNNKNSYGLNILEQKSPKISSFLRVDTKQTFVSIGLLGLPIIPVYFNVFDDLEIKVRVNTWLEEKRFITINSRPCLTINNQPLCASKLMFFGRSFDTTTFQKKEINLSDTNVPNNYNLSDLFDNYNSILVANKKEFFFSLNYVFKCNKECPTSFELDSSDYLTFNDVSINQVKVTFKQVNETHYDFVTGVQ